MVADAQGRARRCFDVFPTWGVGAIGGRAPCFLSFVSCGSCELLPPAARTLYGGAYESF